MPDILLAASQFNMLWVHIVLFQGIPKQGESEMEGRGRGRGRKRAKEREKEGKGDREEGEGGMEREGGRGLHSCQGVLVLVIEEE